MPVLIEREAEHLALGVERTAEGVARRVDSQTFGQPIRPRAAALTMTGGGSKTKWQQQDWGYAWLRCHDGADAPLVWAL